mmetsp:Transcript_15442/g.28493  ORF Transcript_15442/g.28493 Transcript_15442/m.28493 type:complete len:665 (+) Transcript_15442:742-2736(+)
MGQRPSTSSTAETVTTRSFLPGDASASAIVTTQDGNVLTTTTKTRVLTIGEAAVTTTTTTKIVTTTRKARQSSRPFLQALANRQLCFVPMHFLEQIHVKVIDEELTMVGYEGQAVILPQAQSTVHCFLCNSAMAEATELEMEVEGGSDDEWTPDEDSSDHIHSCICQGCNIPLLTDESIGLKCILTGCNGSLCSACTSDPDTRQLCEKTIPQLKVLLKTIVGPSNPMHFGLSKTTGIKRIRELQEQARLKHLSTVVPGLLENAQGTSPGPGAVFLSIGKVNARTIFSIPTNSSALDAAGGSEAISLLAEKPDMDEEGNFEVKIDANSRETVGFAIENVGNEYGYMSVKQVVQGSEAMRKGIRVGDVVVGISGCPEISTAVAVIIYLKSKPAWLMLRREDRLAVAAQVEFEHDENPLVAVAFYQPGVAGSGHRHSVEEFRRFSPQASYLQTIAKDGALKEDSLLGHAVLQVFLKGDTEATHAAMHRGGTRVVQTDTAAAKRTNFAIETKASARIIPKPMSLLTGFFGGGAAALARHSAATFKYVDGTYKKSLKAPIENRTKAFEFVRAHWADIGVYLAKDKTSSQAAEDSPGNDFSSEERLLAALSAQKHKEALAVHSEIVAQNMDWRRETPEMRQKTHRLTEEMLALFHDAEVAQLGASSSKKK